MSIDSLNAAVAAPLSPSTLAGVLTDPARRATVRRLWKHYVHLTPVQATDLVAFCLLFGKPLSRAFSPVRRASKLANGQRPYGAAERAVRILMLGLSGPGHPSDRCVALELTAAERESLLAAARVHATL